MMDPRIIQRRIDRMPDGPEKEKKRKSFDRQFAIASCVQIIMLGMMGILTLVAIFILLLAWLS